jgi:hypothetical protein
MNRAYRWTAILAALVLPAALSCGDAPLAPHTPVPGALIVSLETNGVPAGAIVVRVKGEQIADVTALDAAHTIFIQQPGEAGGEWQVAVVGTRVSGALFSFAVPDVTRPEAYAVALVEVADEANNVRPDIAGYRLSVLRKQ